MDFKLIERPKQRHLEDFLLYVREESPEGINPLFGENAPRFHAQGVVARAGVKAGWVAEPALTVEDVGELDWEDCDELAGLILEAYTARVFPNPNS